MRLWPNGKTDSGWGLTERKGEGPGFMKRYLSDDFNARKILYGYERDAWAFAWVMRASRAVCVDIDGKNGGFGQVELLGVGNTPTTAETSKSGNGYHLFYDAPDDIWNDVTGFAMFTDQIGIELGVDIRATGCVYHYPSQRWNGRPLAPMPPLLHDILTRKLQTQQAKHSTIVKTLELEEEEILVMQDALLEELKAAKIPTGKRNNTLFAMGSKLKLAEIEGWEEAVEAKATKIGLDTEEIEKLLRNIDTYA